MFYSKTRSLLYLFILILFALDAHHAISQQVDLLKDSDKLEAKGKGDKEDDNTIDKLEKNESAANVKYIKIGDLAKIQKNGLFTMLSPTLKEKMNVMTRRIEYQDDKNYTFYGVLSDDVKTQGEIMLISQKGKVFGWMKFKSESYQIFGCANGLSCFLPNKKPLKGENLCSSGGIDKKIITVDDKLPTSGRESVDAACVNTNRVLIMYTPRAYNQCSNVSQIGNGCIQQWKQVLINSIINNNAANLELADIIQTPDAVNSSYGIEANTNPAYALAYASSNQQIKNLRDQYQADLVVILTEDVWTYTKGISPSNITYATDPNLAYAIVAVNWALSNSCAFTHEVGHLFGCKHEPSDQSNGISYAHAYVHPTENSCKTVMYSGLDDKNLLFSTPTVNLGTNPQPMGDYNTYNNAYNVNDQANNIINFRPTYNVMTVGLSGTSNITSPGYYTYTADATCGNTPYAYQWYVSYDGYNYTLVRSNSTSNTSDSYSVGVYPGSSYANYHQIYFKLITTSFDGQQKINYKYVGVGNIHNLRDNSNSNVTSSLGNNISITNFPNPSTDEVNFEYIVPESENVRLEIFDDAGRYISTVASGSLDKGIHTSILNTRSFSNGSYFAKLTLKDNSTVSQFKIIK